MQNPTNGSRGPLEPAKVFQGKRLFVLGGTGFVGKLFWVMLLDRYPGVESIHLLVRPSKGKTSEERFFEDVLQSGAFDALRKKYPGDAFDRFMREKIIPVGGDVGKPLCGVDPALVDSLRGTIDAVVNVAGVVDFNPPLDEALDANAFGSQNLVALAKALGDAPLMHTSTCYVAGRRKGPIFETDPTEFPFPRADELGRDLWDPDREIEECLDLIAQAKHRADDAFRQSEFQDRAKKNLLARGEPTEGPAFDLELQKVKRKFIAERLVEAGLDRATHWGWPNIYTYTKSIGEQVIARSGLRWTIVRPACCETTVEYPQPAWNEGLSTSVPIIYLALKGQMSIPGRHLPLDFIPSDMVAAGMVLSLCELLEGSHRPVYQYGASDINPCTAARFGELIGLYKRKHWQKKGGVNPLVRMYQTYVEPIYVPPERFNRLGPPGIAKATDATVGLLKKIGLPWTKPVQKTLEKVAKQEQKIGEVINLFEPFTSRPNGPFDCTNTRDAYARLPEADRALLPWYPEKLDWADWMMNYHMPGVEKWVLPDMDRKLAREAKPLKAFATLVHLVEEMRERHEHAVALRSVEDDGLTRVSFLDLRERAWAASGRLHDAGVKKGARIVLLAKNSPSWPLAYFGILRAGAVAVPVDSDMRASELENVLRESGAAFVVSDRTPSDVLSGLNGMGDQTTVLPIDGLVAEGDASSAPEVDIAPDDMASIIYTSGTTSAPKGVKLSHANFTSLVAALAPLFPLTRGDRVLSVLPLHHTFEFTCGLLLPLSRGASVTYLDGITAKSLGDALDRGRITAMVGVPALWQMIERGIRTEVDGRGLLAKSAFDAALSLNKTLRKSVGVDAGRVLFGPVHRKLGGNIRYLISGGAALPKETYDLLAGLGLNLAEGYGLTEAAPVLTVARPGPRAKSGHVGKAIPGIELEIRGKNADGVGEIVARGPNVMLGYTDESETARVLDADGWLKTGDLGRFDKKGQLEIVGRSKEVIVTATGENVYPDDVESRLGKVAYVEELVVCGCEIEGRERVGCLAVPAASDELTRQERHDRASRALRDAIRALPYGEQPGIVRLYDAPLPRTATRKVRRTEARQILERLEAATRALRADADAESAVRDVLAKLTGRPAGSITSETLLQGELGVDSLMLVELTEVLDAKGVAFDSGDLADCQTVGDIEARLGVAAKRVARTKTIEDAPAKPIVLPDVARDMGKTMVAGAQRAFYDQVMDVRVTGRAFVPHNRQTIVVANHASHLDMGLVKYALGSYGDGIVSLAAQDYFFGNGVRRAFFENLTNLAPFDRRGNLRQSLRQAAEILERGHTVLVFPEGTRSNDGAIAEFKPLVGYLALTNAIDILPVYLGGTHAAMPKGASVPRGRRLVARIGKPLTVGDLRAATDGLPQQDAAREVAKLARRAVLALSEGSLFDLAATDKASLEKEPDHPLLRVFRELEGKFDPGAVDGPVSFYFTLGGDALAKWTVRIDKAGCDIRPGKPEQGADCVLKTSPELFTRIVRESYVPSPQEFISGAIKSNDVALLQKFQKAFGLG